MSDTPDALPSSASVNERAIMLAFALFLVTRLGLLVLVPPMFSDVPLYAQYAVRAVDARQTPYADYRIEYPPVSYWLTLPPRWLNTSGPANAGFLRRYHLYFRIEMLLFDVLACLLFMKAVQLRRPEMTAWAVAGYALTGLLLAPVLYDRLDTALLFLLMLWLWGVEASRRESQPLPYLATACAALGIGIAHKLVPLVALPFFGLYLLSRTRHTVPLLACSASLVAAAAMPFLAQWLISGDDLWWFFTFHGQRGLEVESIYASVLIILRPLTDAFAYQGPGSWDVGGRFADDLASASTFIILIALALLGLWNLITFMKGKSQTILPALLAIVAATVLAKVISTQYFVWVLPLLLYAGIELLDRNAFLVLVALCLLIAAATTYIFPLNFFQVMNRQTGDLEYPFALIQGTGAQRSFHPVTAWVLLARNVLLVSLTSWLILRMVLARGLKHDTSVDQTTDGSRNTMG